MEFFYTRVDVARTIIILIFRDPALGCFSFFRVMFTTLFRHAYGLVAVVHGLRSYTLVSEIIFASRTQKKNGRIFFFINQRTANTLVSYVHFEYVIDNSFISNYTYADDFKRGIRIRYKNDTAVKLSRLSRHNGDYGKRKKPTGSP